MLIACLDITVQLTDNKTGLCTVYKQAILAIP